MLNQQLFDAVYEAKTSAATVLPIGELEITSNILVLFLLE
jgi:hypothetical protein